MSRQRDKGTRFETAFVAYERRALGDHGIRRAAPSGSRDEGDVHGISCGAGEIVVECKDCRRYELREWLRQADAERDNAGADLGVVAFHLNGVGVADVGSQAVLMTVDAFNALVAGGAL